MKVLLSICILFSLAITNNCQLKSDQSSFTNLDTIDSTKKIVSPNEYWSFQLLSNGQISVSDSYMNNYHFLGNANTGIAPYTAKIQTDGKFYIYSSTGAVTWNTIRRTSTGGAPFRFQIQQDMNLVLTSADGPTVLYAPDIFIPSFPKAGCVWLYTGNKFSLTKTELCSENPNIQKTTSSILLPERFLRCSCTSSCYKIDGTSWTYTNFQAATQDSKNPNLKTLEFDAFGSDLLIGMLSSNSSSSLLYAIVIGGFANLKTRVVNPSKIPLSGCDYNLLFVTNPYEATKYKIIINNTSKTITLFSNENKTFECSIPSLSFNSINQWGFSNSSPGQNRNDVRYICPLKADGSTDAQDCMWTTTTIKIYTESNYGGRETILNKPIIALAALDLDRQIASIKMTPVCYVSCASCNLLGTADNHKCCTCAANYYPLSDNPSQCYTIAEPPAKYFFDTNQYKPCYKSCLTCSVEGTDTNHNCLTCKASYYKIMSTSNCFNSPLNYYLDVNLNEYKPCYANCSTCTGDGTASNNECLTCKSAYYPLVDNIKNCFGTNPDGYFLDINIQKYNKCFTTCNACTSSGTISNHNCYTCKLNYFKIENTNNCFISTDIIPKYYFSSADNLFKSCPSNCDSCTNSSICSTCNTGYTKNSSTNLCEICYTSCSTCSGVGSELDHKCTICKSNYFKQDLTSNCFVYNTKINNYFYDSTLQIFKSCVSNCYQCTNSSTCDVCNSGYQLNDITNLCEECYSTCSTCTAKGDVNFHKCTNCKPNLYLYFKDLSYNCYPSSLKIDQFYFDTDSNKFLKCPTGCLVCTSQLICSQCQVGFTLQSDKTCINNSSSMMPIMPSCHPTCSTCSALGNEKDHKCKTCIAGNYFLENTNNCYQENSYIQGYYLDLKLRLFTKCINGCTYCTNNFSCGSCYLTHQLDSVTKTCKKVCYNSCKTCDEVGDSKLHKCTSCKDGFYFQDKTLNCFNSDFNLYTYYFDKLSKLFKKCPENCITCTGNDSPNEIICSNCMDGYFYQALSNKCEECYSTCKICKDKGDILNHKCISCKNITDNLHGSNCHKSQGDFDYFNSIIQAYTSCDFDCEGCEADIQKYCTKCKINNSFMFKDTCIPCCPSGSGYKADKYNRCKPCKYFSKINFDGNCVDECPGKYINLEGVCRHPCQSGQFMLNSTCLINCPENYIVDNKLFECLPLLKVEEKIDNIFSYELQKPLTDRIIFQLSESIYSSKLTITNDLIYKIVTIFNIQINLALNGIRAYSTETISNQSLVGIMNLGDLAIFLNSQK